jgi:hypothetical protein
MNDSRRAGDQIRDWEQQTSFDHDLRFLDKLEAYLEGVALYATPEQLTEVAEQLRTIAHIAKPYHSHELKLQAQILETSKS